MTALQVTTDSQREMLRTEAEHFYQAELAHENRASWLLALSAGLVAVLNDAGSTAGAQWAVWLGNAALGVAALGAIVAIWPLAGRRAGFWSILRGPTSSDLIRGWDDGDQWLLEHYYAHRRRAQRKGVWVARTATALVTGVLLTVTVLLS